jgi:tripartite-type tricarboxylate transporter receptor subunit TctC
MKAGSALFAYVVLGIVALVVGSRPVEAQYPERVVTVVVLFPAGGAVDVIGRLAAQELSRRLGHQFIVENRGGASGTVGSAGVAKAAPNGYTLLVGSGTPIGAARHIYPTLPYDDERDFTPISHLVTTAAVLVVRPDSNFRSVAELVEYAKSNPGKLSYGTSGIGSTEHVATLQLAMSTGIRMQDVAYRGTTPALNDLFVGSIDFIISSTATLAPYVETGKLRGLAVTSRERSKLLPDVPTMQEAGVAGYESINWYGMLGPANLPKDIADKLNAVLTDYVRSSEGSAKLTGLGFEIGNPSREEFRKLIADEGRKFGRIFQASRAPKE